MMSDSWSGHGSSAETIMPGDMILYEGYPKKGLKIEPMLESTATTGKFRFIPDFHSAADWGVDGPWVALVSITVMTVKP